MRNRTRNSLGVALVLAMTLLPAANAGADPRIQRGRAAALRQAQAFDVSGEYSGVLTGVIELGGVAYRLAPTARIYEIGQGPVPMGGAVDNRYVYLSGRRSGSFDLIYSVIICPPSDPSTDGSDVEGRVRVADGSAPR